VAVGLAERSGCCEAQAMSRNPWYLVSLELLSRDEIQRISAPERLALIAQLWDSLEPEQIPLTAAQHTELDRRMAQLTEDSRQSISWSDLKAELEQRCP
jgi:putative addiction module component (TIGR02574 family)